MEAVSVEAVPEAIPAPAPIRWSLVTRSAFRFAFCYFMIYALCCGNSTPWEIIPFHIGEFLESWLNWPFTHAAQWLAQRLFHVQGVGAKLHDTGSGDTAIAWICLGVMLVTALVATLLWSILDRRRTQYRKLLFWFRLTLRLTLGVAMLNYGFAKVFPLQMAPPSLAVLNEPFGNISPMTLLWTMIGLNPLYEMICGAAEVVSGVLILFRRTAMLGALLTAFVVSNVVLYNFFFDVPVKIYASHLLLMSLVYLAPDLRTLYSFFILHKPCAPAGGWTRPARRYGMRGETVITVAVLALVVILTSVDLRKGLMQQRAAQRNPSVFTGQWHVDSATFNGAPQPYLTGDGMPMVDLFLERNGKTMIRSSDQVLWRAGIHIDQAKHTLRLGNEFHDPVVYALAQPDPLHMILTPTGEDAKKQATLQLTRVPLPSHYPLEERGFHLINEWGLER